MSSSSPDTAPSSDSGNNDNNSDDYGDPSQSPPSPPPPDHQTADPNDDPFVNSPPPPDQNSSGSNNSDSGSSSGSNSDSGSSNKGSSGGKSPSPSSGPSPNNGKSSNSGSSSSDSSSSSTPNLTPKSSGGNKQSPPALPDSSEKSSGDKNGDSRAIIGAAVGVGFLLLIMIVVCVICCRKKKRKHRYYYSDDGKPGKSASGYYNRGQNPNNWHPGGNDHVVRMQQSPGMGTGMGPDSGGWGPVPPPPPPHSTDMSSNYSLGPPPLPPPSPGLSLGLNCGTFSFEDLAAATEGFADKNLIGQGGFGYVHKGVLPNGKEVAVKSLKAGSGQGEREFQAEIEIISRVHHRHLVSLNGYCIAGGQRMLVYEFVPNNTLEHHLHGKGLPTMTWPDRLRIAVGSAKGLAYLHEDCHPRIIHRDIKSANVLLDDSFEAKVADFGLAKLTTDNNTHVSTRVMGTFGYLAPEYASSGKLTEKSDVFSFGVMLLELMTGKRPIDIQNMMDDSLVDWARPLLARGLEDGNFEELVDPFLEGNYNNQELSRMAACASASIRHSGKKRPKMSQIVRALEGDVSLEDLNDTRAGHSHLLASSSSSDYDSSAYQADMKRFRQIALASQEFGSSESSGEMSQLHQIPKQHL
ncbi:proline-rich receptor-like protein kinase PERK4 [Prosopis cineraria]|uniref:proline-rich receptor-like protein kinase PERK4 n=1 Tax=Prosopis cineraria TaxID=364024 RepID=UPI002410281A|nr:proline-rich receptor-like protein kinase PERK4 [Prosopis cineraria]